MPRCFIVGLVGLLIACGNKASGGEDDCKLITRDPAAAGRKLLATYPSDPVKVAAVIEQCVAPTGTPCERFAAFVKTMPDMMPPGTATLRFPDPEASCAAMSPEMQRCLVPSYLLAHDAECADVRSRQPLPMVEKKILVLTVTETELLLDGKHIAGIDDQITAAVTAALKAIVVDPGAPAPTLVLKAGTEANAKTINRITNGARAAGFDNVLFDVETP